MPNNKQKQNWTSNIAKAQEAIQELIDIQDEVQEKYDDMSESEKETDRGMTLGHICDLDFASAMDVLNDAEDIGL